MEDLSLNDLSNHIQGVACRKVIAEPKELVIIRKRTA